jgi:hypothetical protein
MELSAETMFQCVNLWFNNGAGSVPRHESIMLDWGDGTTSWPDLVPGRLPHTYGDPGEYTITMWPLTGCGAGGSMTIGVVVQSAPVLPLSVSHLGGNRLLVETSEQLDTEQWLRSKVDWGDGSPLQEFDWSACGENALCTPAHDYAAPGDYTIRVRIEYIGATEQPCYEREATLLVTAGDTTPVHTATWGAIKALYK